MASEDESEAAMARFHVEVDDLHVGKEQVVMSEDDSPLSVSGSSSLSSRKRKIKHRARSMRLRMQIFPKICGTVPLPSTAPPEVAAIEIQDAPTIAPSTENVLSPVNIFDNLAKTPPPLQSTHADLSASDDEHEHSEQGDGPSITNVDQDQNQNLEDSAPASSTMNKGLLVTNSQVDAYMQEFGGEERTFSQSQAAEPSDATKVTQAISGDDTQVRKAQVVTAVEKMAIRYAKFRGLPTEDVINYWLRMSVKEHHFVYGTGDKNKKILCFEGSEKRMPPNRCTSGSLDKFEYDVVMSEEDTITLPNTYLTKHPIDGPKNDYMGSKVIIACPSFPLARGQYGFAYGTVEGFRFDVKELSFYYSIKTTHDCGFPKEFKDAEIHQSRVEFKNPTSRRVDKDILDAKSLTLSFAAKLKRGNIAAFGHNEKLMVALNNNHIRCLFCWRIDEYGKILDRNRDNVIPQFYEQLWKNDQYQRDLFELGLFNVQDFADDYLEDNLKGPTIDERIRVPNIKNSCLLKRLRTEIAHYGSIDNLSRDRREKYLYLTTKYDLPQEPTSNNGDFDEDIIPSSQPSTVSQRQFFPPRTATLAPDVQFDLVMPTVSAAPSSCDVPSTSAQNSCTVSAPTWFPAPPLQRCDEPNVIGQDVPLHTPMEFTEQFTEEIVHTRPINPYAFLADIDLGDSVDTVDGGPNSFASIGDTETVIIQQQRIEQLEETIDGLQQQFSTLDRNFAERIAHEDAVNERLSEALKNGIAALVEQCVTKQMDIVGQNFLSKAEAKQKALQMRAKFMEQMSVFLEESFFENYEQCAIAIRLREELGGTYDGMHNVANHFRDVDLESVKIVPPGERKEFAKRTKFFIPTNSQIVEGTEPALDAEPMEIDPVLENPVTPAQPGPSHREDGPSETNVDPSIGPPFAFTASKLIKYRKIDAICRSSVVPPNRETLWAMDEDSLELIYNLAQEAEGAGQGLNQIGNTAAGGAPNNTTVSPILNHPDGTMTGGGPPDGQPTLESFWVPLRNTRARNPSEATTIQLSPDVSPIVPQNLDALADNEVMVVSDIDSTATQPFGEQETDQVDTNALGRDALLPAPHIDPILDQIDAVLYEQHIEDMQRQASAEADMSSPGLSEGDGPSIDMYTETQLDLMPRRMLRSAGPAPEPRGRVSDANLEQLTAPLSPLRPGDMNVYSPVRSETPSTTVSDLVNRWTPLTPGDVAPPIVDRTPTQRDNDIQDAIDNMYAAIGQRRYRGSTGNDPLFGNINASRRGTAEENVGIHANVENEVTVEAEAPVAQPVAPPVAESVAASEATDDSDIVPVTPIGAKKKLLLKRKETYLRKLAELDNEEEQLQGRNVPQALKSVKNAKNKLNKLMEKCLKALAESETSGPTPAAPISETPASAPPSGSENARPSRPTERRESGSESNEPNTSSANEPKRLKLSTGTTSTVIEPLATNANIDNEEVPDPGREEDAINLSFPLTEKHPTTVMKLLNRAFVFQQKDKSSRDLRKDRTSTGAVVLPGEREGRVASNYFWKLLVQTIITNPNLLEILNRQLDRMVVDNRPARFYEPCLTKMLFKSAFQWTTVFFPPDDPHDIKTYMKVFKKKVKQNIHANRHRVRTRIQNGDEPGTTPSPAAQTTTTTTTTEARNASATPTSRDNTNGTRRTSNSAPQGTQNEDGPSTSGQSQRQTSSQPGSQQADRGSEGDEN